jgi:HAD superfamily hydrolase (TIGR01509 family)
MIKAVIFDLDGVLVDAVTLHYQAFSRAINLFGFEVPPAIHGFNYNGLPTTVKLEMLSQFSALPRGLHAFINEMKQVYTQELLNQKLKPSLIQINLLKTLRDRGMKLAVASNCTRSTVDLVLEKLQIRPFFDVILSKDDVSKSKPDPEMYLKCFKQLGINGDEALILEDSRPGVMAAQKATSNVSIVKSPTEVNLSYLNSQIAKFRDQTYLDSRTVEIVIPMAGLGSRFSDVGYVDPKPLIKVNGKPMIQWVIENLSSQNYRTHFNFIVNRTHLENFDLERRLTELAPGCQIISVPQKTEGAACTVLLALDRIALDRPLIIANSDQFVESSFEEFLKTGLESDRDGLIMTFPAKETKWSYARLDEQGLVVEVAEKKPISSHATVGIYYFKTAELFQRASYSMIRSNIRTNNEFYVCPVYNELIQAGGKVSIFPIPAEAMHGLGTPEDLDIFLQRSVKHSQPLAA